jgi:predicted outer membrane repeat protein
MTLLLLLGACRRVPPPEAETKASIVGDGTLSMCTGTWYVALTLDGAIEVIGLREVTLDGLDTGVPVTATGASLNLTDLTITDGAGDRGGCFSYMGDSLTLTRVTLDSCRAVESGGGGYAEATDLVVIESVFTNNVVEGDSSWVAGGGLSVLGSTGTVTGSTFTGNDLFELQNTYTYGGGLAFDGESLTVSDTTFSGNYMDSDASGTFALGGGIWTSADLVAERIVATGNDLGGSGYGGGGGGLCCGVMTVRDSTISDNVCRGAGFGGAIVGNDLVIEDTTIENNHAAYKGGAIFSTTDVILDRVDMIDNYARSYGGAVYTEDTVYLTDSTSTGNSRGADGYYCSGSCVRTVSDDYAGIAASVSLAPCESEMTW